MPTVQQLQSLEQAIYFILQQHPDGIREHDLMVQLSEHHAAYEAPEQANNLSMFQSHFLLFHCLYRLRDALRASAQAELDIHCLNIQLKPYFKSDQTLPVLAEPDKLAQYYSDIRHLDETGEQDVENLLDQFWRRYVAQDHLDEALAELELSVPVTWSVIKKQYRQLAMQYHPDRGGDAKKLQAINEAMTKLKAYYS